MKPCICKTCKDTKPINFFRGNKSTCKKCISCQNKIKRKTVRPDDENVRSYCQLTGLNFDEICQDCNKTITKVSTPIPIQSSVVRSDRDYDNKLKELNDTMMGRTEFNEMGVMEVRRRLDEILADQERSNDNYEQLETKYEQLEKKYNKLEEKFKEMEQVVIRTAHSLNDNYYNKEKVVEKIKMVVNSSFNNE